MKKNYSRWDHSRKSLGKCQGFLFLRVLFSAFISSMGNVGSAKKMKKRVDKADDLGQLRYV